MADVISKAVSDAILAVSKSIPSQSANIGVECVRPSDGGTRTVRGTIRTAIVTSGFSDPIGEFDVSTEALVKTVVFTKCGEGGWFDVTPPRIGDIFTIPPIGRFSVFSVEEKSSVYFKVGVKQC